MRPSSVVAPRHAPARATLSALALVTLPLASLPSVLRAQYTELGVFSAWSGPMGGTSAPLYGGSVGGSSGTIGLRLSGAMRGGMSSLAAEVPDVSPDRRTWRMSGMVVDMDLVLDTRNNALLQPIAASLLGFSPSVFAGSGMMARRDEAGQLRAAPTVSYGGGVSRTILGIVAVNTEARWRAPFRGIDRDRDVGLESGWEYRAGLSLRLGGPRRTPGSVIPRLPIPMPGGAGSAGTMGTASGSAVVSTGDDFLGVPYVYGGATPRGFDCSGFVLYVFNRHGVRLPRTSRQQAQVGRKLPTTVGALQPGDLIFFSTSGSRVDHVAMYAGDNRMIHSSSSGGGVRFDDLDSSRGRWFLSKMVAARRVTDGRGKSFVDQATLTRLLGEAVRTFDGPDTAPRP